MRLLTAALGALVLIAGAVLGLHVWRAGRTVVDAFCWWTLLPEQMPGGGAGATAWRDAPARDAVKARTFALEGWRPLRLALAVGALLSPLAFVQLAVLDSPRFTPTWHHGHETSLAVGLAGLTLSGVVTGVVVFGGQLRANRAHAERDPIWRRLRAR